MVWSSRERSVSALNLEEPDKVPIFELSVDPPVLSRVLGWGAKGTAILGGFTKETSIEKLRRDSRDVVVAYKKAFLDMVPCRYMAPDGWKPTFVEKNKWIDEFGRVWFDNESGVRWYIEGMVKELKDLENLSNLNPYDDGRTIQVEEVVSEAKKYDMAVIGYITGTFLLAWMACGLKAFLLKLFTDPSFARRILHFICTFNEQIINRIADCGVDAFLLGGDIADVNGPWISREMFRAHYYPYLKKEVDTVKKRGLPVVFHSDGNINLILDDIVECGIDGLQAIEPTAKMDIARLKQKYGDKLCLIGNVDCGYTLTLGTSTDVADETKRIIEEISPGGGHMMGSSNSIHHGVKFENFKAMIDITRKYGRYVYS